MKPKISVVMATYNEPENYLRQAIESILNQTFRDFEFIIILDNPKNKLHEEIIKEYQRVDNRIIFIKNEKNLGLAASLNRGIKTAKGKYIARMDADDITLPKRLEIQYNYLEKNKDIDVLFTDYCYILDNNTDTLDFKDIKNKDINVQNMPCKIITLETVLFNRFPCHATMLAKSHILKENKYSEIGRPEDFDLFIRLLIKNYKLYELGIKLYLYRKIEWKSFNNFDIYISKMSEFFNNYPKILKKYEKELIERNISYIKLNLLITKLRFHKNFLNIIKRSHFLKRLYYYRIKRLYLRSINKRRV